ncbi:MAG: carboxypeptidase CpsA [Thaumarchaeota archaeon]|nr:carboxypeptidase CpsA [Nitrososphaerota archaeon]
MASLDLMAEAKKIEPEIIAFRRDLHANPELSYMENRTAKVVAERLRDLGIEVKTNIGGTTGVLGILRGGNAGKVIGLRADMDALPVTEEVDLPFKSINQGVMHSCGHDTHVAMLMGAAEILSKHREEISGTVKFFFQPAEEDGGRGGAKPMIEAGVMENPKVDYVFGLHIGGEYDSGTFGVRPGPFMAAPDAFRIRIIGKGGHGSRPHETIDPIFVSAQLIVALQGISSRIINPVKPFVVSVCSIHSGTKDNIIPDDALLLGTIRTMDERTRRLAKKSVSQITRAVCNGFNAKYELSFKEDAYPVTYNNEKVTQKVIEILKTIKGTKTSLIDVKLGAEDFSRFLQKAPGTFYYIGTRNEKKGCIYPNHSSKFKVDEDVLKFGAVSLAKLALEFGKS